MIRLTNEDIQDLSYKLAIEIIEKEYFSKHLKIYGTPRGGIPVAYIITSYLNDSIVVDDPEEADVFIDDLIDSGATLKRYQDKYNKPFYALIDKRINKDYDDWVEFPWEKQDEETPIEDNIERIRQYLKGEPEDTANVLHLLQDLTEEISAIKK